MSVFNTTNNLKNLMKVLVIALVLPFNNAFIEDMGQAFNGMGDQLDGFVDSLYKSVDSWAEHIIEHAKEEECHFICPHGLLHDTIDEIFKKCYYSVGKPPKDNMEYEHKPTGCGPLGKKINDSDLPIKEMRECCDDHQMCYHKCGAVKNNCDHKFNRCLLKKCKETQKELTHLKGCKTATKLLMMSFLTFGCKSFKDSQKKCCLCIGNEEL